MCPCLVEIRSVTSEIRCRKQKEEEIKKEETTAEVTLSGKLFQMVGAVQSSRDRERTEIP